MSNIPITPGTGAASVATETVGGLNYQQIQVYGAGGASVLGINPDHSITVSVLGVQGASVSGTVAISSLLSIPAIVSAVNSTTSTLGGGAVFTGTSEEVKDFGSIVVNVFADQASATDGLSIQQSSNGTNWDITDTYTVAASTGKTFQVQPAARFFRVVYTNGATPSTVMRLQTIFHPQMVKATSQRATDGYSNETDLEQQQGFGMVFNGTTWDRARGTAASGTLIYGSVQAVQSGTQITSISGGVSSVALVGANTVSVVGTIGASIIGTVPVTQTGAWTASVIGSVTTLQGTNPWIVTSSIAGGLFPITGSVAATITNTNVNVSGSVVAFVVGGASSVITYVQNSSILAVPVGSVITVLQAPSIVGTYAEDAPSASGDKGFLVMGARNDTLASVTSADGDYSSHVVGPAGELIAENAPLNKWVSGTASMLGGVPLTCSVTVIAAQGSSIFTYITGVQVANLGSASVLVSFGAGTSSLIAYTIAPAGGGSNIYFQNGIKTNANSAFSASVSGTASIYVSAQGFISKT